MYLLRTYALVFRLSLFPAAPQITAKHCVAIFRRSDEFRLPS